MLKTNRKDKSYIHEKIMRENRKQSKIIRKVIKKFNKVILNKVKKQFSST